MKPKGGKLWKALRDPDKPKRPLSAFFVLMEEFREQYKEKHPKNKSVIAVGRACGEKWKSMNQKEKAPYIEKALKLKHDYEQKMLSYYKKLESSWEESGSEDVAAEIQEKAALKHKRDHEQMESNRKKPESSRRPEKISPDNRNRSGPQAATSSDRESVILELHKKMENALEAYHTNLRDDINIKMLKELKEDGAFELLGLELRLTVRKILHDNSYMLEWRSMSRQKRIEWLQREISNVENYCDLA